MPVTDHIHRNIEHKCRIISNRHINDDVFILEIENKVIAESSKPGQFVNVDCGSFLKRPISICGTDKDKGTFSIGIRIKGEGTRRLSSKIAGDELTVIGPLGNCFDLFGVSSLVAVGGGIGIFPLMFLIEEAKRMGIKSTAVCGYRSLSESFCTIELSGKADKTCFSSDCGDMDFHGNAAQALSTLELSRGQTVFTCGPIQMMKSVYSICEAHEVKCFASLEERMGCGTGICLVCACKIKTIDKSGNSDYEYKRCCYDGPVFDASEVVWD